MIWFDDLNHKNELRDITSVKQSVSKHQGVTQPPSPPNRLKQTGSVDLIFVPTVLAVHHFDWQTSVRVRECRGKLGRAQNPLQQSQYFISTPEEGLHGFIV